MDSRDRILSRLPSQGERAQEAPPEPTGDMALPVDWTLQAAARLEKQGASVYQAENLTAARLHLVSWLQGRDVQAVIGWPPAEVGIPGLEDTLATLGVQWQVASLGEGPRSGRASSGWVVLTGAHGLIWPTGSLLFVNTPTTPLHPIAWAAAHVVVVLPDRVYPSLAAWRRAEQPRGTVVLMNAALRSWAFGAPPVPSRFSPPETHVVLVQTLGE